jgi:membrane-associated phospholipid phosphatase
MSCSLAQRANKAGSPTILALYNRQREGRVTQHSYSKEGRARTARSARNGWRAVRAPTALVGGYTLLVAIVALLLLGWGLGDLSRSVAGAPDLHLVDELATHRTAVLTVIAHWLSWVGSSAFILLWTVVVFVVLHRNRRADAFAVVVSSAGAAAIFYLDKLLVGRPRPPVQHLEAVSSASFPSGHATQSTAFYLALGFVVLAARPPRAAATAVAVATALLVAGIAISRVYLGVHYPSDVAGGVLLGGMWAALVRSCLCRSVPSSGANA